MKYFTILLLMMSMLLPKLMFTQVQIGIDIDGEASGDNSGESVSLSADGTRLAIGAPRNDGNGGNSGHVRIYERSGGTWTQIGSDIDGEEPGDNSGHSVSLSADGTRIAIGAPRNSPGFSSDKGHVRIYQESGGTWTQVGLDIDGQYSNDRAGTSVSLSADGTRVAIGAPQNNPGVGSNLGQVRVYQESGGIWTQIGADIIGEASGNFSGRAVSLSSDGTYLAIGAPNNGGNGANSGHVRIYQISGGTWTQVGPDIDGEASGDYSGGSVSLSSNGARVAIGATTNAGNGTNSGHVRIYEMSGGSWTQVGTDIDGAAAYDNSGSSVSLSDDGTLLVIGAHYNDANGANSGHVRIYEESGGTWTQTGIDINGEAAANYSGSSVAVSSDGTHIAIGAFGNAENGTNSGHVRVFSNLSLPVELLFFKGELQEKEILLSWKTATEENNEGFQVEQSDDGINWKEITFVKGNGTSAEVHNYQYLDSDPVMGINHYRLKQTDYDGTFEYSKIISIHWKVKGISIGEFYPNPSFSKLVYLSCYSATDGELSITVLDINGRELTKEIRQISNGTNNLEFNLTDLNKGIYFIKIENRQNISYQQVILE